MPEQIGETQYLRILGRLYPDNQLKLRPSFLVQEPSRFKIEDNSPLHVHMLDKEQQLLLSHPLAVRQYDPYAGRSEQKQVSGRVPFPLQTRFIYFYLNDILIHKVTVDEESPNIEMDWNLPKLVKGVQTIQWKAWHPHELPLQYILKYTHNDGQDWQRIGIRIDETKQDVDFDILPGGASCQISVLATDGVNTATAFSRTFEVPIKPCLALILKPQNGATFSVGEAVEFTGQGFYREENTPEFEHILWFSSLDGELGTGRNFRIQELSPGKHTIGLLAGNNERQGKAEVIITIVE